MSRRHFLRLAVGALALAGCQDQKASIGPEGDLAILDNLPLPLSATSWPEDWLIDGPASGLSRAFFQGLPALRVENGPTGFAAVRRTRALLLATPYLSWSWNAEAHDLQGHAVHLLIGFKGGRNGGSGRGGLPDHDRLLAIAWGGSALQRGALFLDGGTGEPARYTARGGRENTGTWLRENLDLQDFYRRAWPNDDRGAVRIAFIGVAAAAGQPPSAIRYSGILLSR